MSEGPSKPGAIADVEALSGSDDAQARVRAWWRLVPRVPTRPREVFVALRDDDETDVDARSEPILAIVIVAGMAAMLLTPAWGTLLDEESLDWIVLAVVTFIGGLLYGAFGYFLLGLVVWLVVSPVSAFVIPSELGNMYAGDGKEKPVTGLTGLWLFPFGIFVIPAIVWAVKVQGSLNRYWDEAATPAAATPSALPAADPAPAPASPVPAEAETGEEPTATDT